MTPKTDGIYHERHSAFQPWVEGLPIMQQSVLMTAVRGPDGIAKYHPIKGLMRWYRRSVLYRAFEHDVELDPHAPGGGSFTGPLLNGQTLRNLPEVWCQSVDELPHHFALHMMHAAEIIGCHHSDPVVRSWWHDFYVMAVHDLHLHPETQGELDTRLSDSLRGWQERSSPGTQQ